LVLSLAVETSAGGLPTTWCGGGGSGNVDEAGVVGPTCEYDDEASEARRCRAGRGVLAVDERRSRLDALDEAADWLP